MADGMVTFPEGTAGADDAVVFGVATGVDCDEVVRVELDPEPGVE